MCELSEDAQKILLWKYFFKIILKKNFQESCRRIDKIFPGVGPELGKEDKKSMMTLITGMINGRNLGELISDCEFSDLLHEEIKTVVLDHFHKNVTLKGKKLDGIYFNALAKEFGCKEKEVKLFVKSLWIGGVNRAFLRAFSE
jgi:hypothetical protein